MKNKNEKLISKPFGDYDSVAANVFVVVGIFYEFLGNSNHYTGCGELQPIRWSVKSFYVGVFPSYADLMYFMTFIASCSFRLCRFFTRYREKESSSPDKSGNLVRVASIMLE